MSSVYEYTWLVRSGKMNWNKPRL